MAGSPQVGAISLSSAALEASANRSGISCASQLLVDESFLLRVLRDTLHERILPTGGHQHSLAKPRRVELVAALEGALEDPGVQPLSERLEALWDLCVDAGNAEFLTRNGAVSILVEAAARSQSLGEVDPSEARWAEVCLGILANVCVHRCVVEKMNDDDIGVMPDSALRGLGSPHGAVVLQALRLACALLTGPYPRNCPSLWSEIAITRYLFVLESSLLWDAVRHACDAVNQILVLAPDLRRGDREATLADTCPAEELADAEVASTQVLRMTQERLLSVLSSRIEEMAASEEVDIPEGEGDVEAALLSALCLADSLLAAVPSISSKDSLQMANAALHALAAAERPEVSVQALEVLSSLLDNDEVDPIAHPSADDRAYTALEDCIRAIAGGNAGATITERVLMLLCDTEVLETSVVFAALVVLQCVPRGQLEEQRDVLASAARGYLDGDAPIPRALCANFLCWLGVGHENALVSLSYMSPALDEDQAPSRRFSRSCSRSRSPR